MDRWLPALKALLRAALPALASWASAALSASVSAQGRRLRTALALEAQRLWDVALCTGLALLAGVLGLAALGTAAWMVTPEPWRPMLLGVAGAVLCATGVSLARAARRRLSSPMSTPAMSTPLHPAVPSEGPL